MFLGDQSVGKTSVIYRFKYDYFEDGKIASYFDSKKIEKYNSNGIMENYIDLTTNKGFYSYKNGDKFFKKFPKRGGGKKVLAKISKKGVFLCRR